MKFTVNLIIILLLLLISLSSTDAQENIEKAVFKSSDNKFQITIPGNWEVLEINEDADIQVGNAQDEAYFILLADQKADLFGWNIEKHSRITLSNILSSLLLPEIEGPVYFEIDGKRAVQYKIAGAIEGMNIVYLHTTVESNNYFNQILTWALKSRFSGNEEIFRNVLSSFKVLKDDNE